MAAGMEQIAPYQYWNASSTNYWSSGTINWRIGDDVDYDTPGGFVHVAPQQEVQIIDQKFSQCEYCSTIHRLDKLTVLRCIGCGAPLPLAGSPTYVVSTR